jgi:hypothetical protein
MNILQPLDKLEKFWENPAPWKYEDHPDDLNGKAMLLSVLSGEEYQDFSANAVKHATERSKDIT